MRAAIRWVAESLGIGMLVFIVPATVVYLFLFAVETGDRIMSPLIAFLIGRPVPLAGFLLLLTFWCFVGILIRTERGWLITRPLIDRVLVLKLIFYGARSGTVKRALRSRDPDAPNVVMAPYYRHGAPWPFIILRIVETTDPMDPIIWGAFIDFPFLVKPCTVNASDTIFTGITFDEGALFAFSGGGLGLGKDDKKPRKILLSDYLREARFKRFMEETA